MFANGPEAGGSISGRVIAKTQKMVLDTSLLNTQHYKVRFKGSFFFSVLWQGLDIYLSFRFLSVLHSGQPERQSPIFGRLSFFFFLLITTRSGRLAEIRRFICITKSQRILCVLFFGRILGFVCTICSYGQIFVFHGFFNSLSRSRYLSFFSLSFRFTLWSAGQQSPQFGKFFFFLADYY